MEDMLDDIIVEPKLASIGSRIGAAFIDFVVLVLIFYGAASLWGDRPEEGGLRIQGVIAWLYNGICFLLIPVQEGISGKTIGKRIMGIQVKRKDYQEAGVGLSVVRHLFDLVDCFCLIGIVVAVSSRYRQRVGDAVAGTIVVQG